MNAAAKKEVDISKFKIRTASAGIKSFMVSIGPKDYKPLTKGQKDELAASAAGGGEAALAGAVAEGLKEFEESEEGKEEKQEEEMAKQQQQAAAVEQVEEKRIEHEIKGIKSKIPSRTKLLIAFIIGFIYDVTDLVITIVTAGASETGEWVFDVVMQGLFMYLLGPYYRKVKIFEKWVNKIPLLKDLPAPMLEFIPIVDCIPMYTWSVVKTIKAIKAEHGELSELEKEKRMLKGGAQAEGFLGTSQRTWAILIAIFGSLALVTGLILGPILALIPVAIFMVVVFILMLKNEETRGTAITVGVIVLILGIISFLVFFVVAERAADFGGPLGEWGSKARTQREEGLLWLRDHNPVTLIKTYYKKQILIATGDYYTGKVDENAEAKLGVYLEELKQADPVFYTDRPLIMYANLKVLTLDEPVNVSLYCNTKGLSGDPPKLFPRDKFIVDTYEEQEIDCMFDAGSVRKGSWAFELGADFNFKTMSYVKSYFMDADRLRSMRREEIDPLEQYGIKEKEPEAIYTVGPVGIGMGVGKPPVGIDLEREQATITLGITIENLWEGSITKLDRFVVIVPKGFTIEEIGAQLTKTECSSLPDEEMSLCDDSLNNVYVITDPTFVEVEKGNFKSYRGFMRLNRGDYEKIIGLTPISTKYFKTTVSYTYRLKNIKIIDVKERQTASLIPGTGTIDITGPQIQTGLVEKLSNNSVRISWTTDEESNDNFIWWDVTRAPPVYPPKTTEAEVGFTASHSRTLEDVSSSKTYGYKITSSDSSGNIEDESSTFKIE